MADKKTSAAQLRAQKKYDQDSINFTASYKRLERADALRLKAYLAQTGLWRRIYKTTYKSGFRCKGV